RRPAPLPGSSRWSAPNSNVMRMFTPVVRTNEAPPRNQGGARHGPPAMGTPESIHVQRAHRLLVADPPDRLGEERCDRKPPDARAGARLLRERNRVGHHEL